MKLLFICNASVRDDGLRCASWIKSIVTFLSDDTDVVLASAAEVHSPQRLSAAVGDKKTTVLSIPSSASEADTDRLLQEETADVILIFGTEKSYTLRMLKACGRIGAAEYTALFAQGIASACARHYAEGVPNRVIRRWTFRDLMRRQNIRAEQKAMEAAAKAEQEALRLTRHFIGRTTMDKAFLLSQNPSAAYYRCGDVLRAPFYEGEWRPDGCQRRRIFISQYYYPLKGFHYLLEAAAMLRDKYPDLTIAAAGYNPILRSLSENEFKDSSYIRYLKTLAKRYDLTDRIELLGELDENRMKEEYLRANVFVMPSSIENSPNSLAEAMMLGVPCVASDVGGISDFAVHQKEAYLYPSSAPYLLAYYIDRIFSDDENAALLGKNGRLRAEKEYDRSTNIQNFEDIMKRIARSR